MSKSTPEQIREIRRKWAAKSHWELFKEMLRCMTASAISGDTKHE